MVGSFTLLGVIVKQMAKNEKSRYTDITTKVALLHSRLIIYH